MRMSQCRQTSLKRWATNAISKPLSAGFHCSARSCKKPRPATNSLETTWYTSGRGTSKSLEMGKYGLKRLSYSSIESLPVWTVPPHPPTKTIAERVVFPMTLAIVAGIGLWVYTTPEEDNMTEYWKKVESGRILLDDDYDDDYDDDDDDDDE